MNVAPFSLPRPGCLWFKGLMGMVDWPKCVRRLWEWITHPVHNGARQFKITSRALARILGVGIRSAQMSLDMAAAMGLIERSRDYGPHGGRVIVIVVELAGPRSKTPPKPGTHARNKAERKRTEPGQVPNVGPVRAPEPPELPEPTAEEKAAVDRFMEESRKRREAAERSKAKAPAGSAVNQSPRTPDGPGMKAQAVLEARRKELGIKNVPDPKPLEPPRPADP